MYCDAAATPYGAAVPALVEAAILPAGEAVLAPYMAVTAEALIGWIEAFASAVPGARGGDALAALGSLPAQGAITRSQAAVVLASLFGLTGRRADGSPYDDIYPGVFTAEAAAAAALADSGVRLGCDPASRLFCGADWMPRGEALWTLAAFLEPGKVRPGAEPEPDPADPSEGAEYIETLAEMSCRLGWAQHPDYDPERCPPGDDLADAQPDDSVPGAPDDGDADTAPDLAEMVCGLGQHRHHEEQPGLCHVGATHVRPRCDVTASRHYLAHEPGGGHPYLGWLKTVPPCPAPRPAGSPTHENLAPPLGTAARVGLLLDPVGHRRTIRVWTEQWQCPQCVPAAAGTDYVAIAEDSPLLVHFDDGGYAVVAIPTTASAQSEPGTRSFKVVASDADPLRSHSRTEIEVLILEPYS